MADTQKPPQNPTPPAAPNTAVATAPQATPPAAAPAPYKLPSTLNGMLADDKIRARFEQMLGKKTAGFLSSLMTLYNSNRALREVEPKSIVASAAIAASLDLPINSSLGFAAIVPYKGVAQFQIMWRGFVQLAIRTSQYATMNASLVYADELESWNPITGELKLTKQETWKERYSGPKAKVAGYAAFFRLTNGFEKFMYMTAAETRAHGMKYSKSFSNPKGKWALDFDAMSLKTVIKLLLSRWGIMSVELQTAMKVDQAVVHGDDKMTYEDNPNDALDVEEITDDNDPDRPQEAAPAPAAAEPAPADKKAEAAQQQPAPAKPADAKPKGELFDKK